MTIYVGERGWTVPGGMLFNLWADTSDEAVMALYAVGGDPVAQRRTECNAWEAYAVTPEQFADLIGLGVTVTDQHGATYWIAQRNGDQRMIDRIDLARLLAR